MKVTLRPATEADEPFLRRLIVETIADELGTAAWPEPMRGQLLEMQYRGRRQSAMRLVGAQSLVIERDRVPAGWVLVVNQDDEIRLVEIMVAGDARGAGIGSAVMRLQIEAARALGKPVRLEVNLTNTRAIALYTRLGFRLVEGNEVQQAMEAW